MTLAEEARQDTRAGVEAILAGYDDLEHPEYRPDLRIELDAMQLSPEPDPRTRALCYWMTRDRLWYESADAWRLLRTLSGRQQRILEIRSQRQWAPPRRRWTWDTLLPRIAADQHIFSCIVTCGPTRAGVEATSDKAIAQDLFKLSKTEARRIYLEYRRQTAMLLGYGTRPPRDWARWLRDEGLLTSSGRIRTDAVLTNMEDVAHWFAHALRNLRRYRNGDTRLPWPADPKSCKRRCHQELVRLLPNSDPPPSR